MAPLCKKDRETRLKKKIVERFEDQLDIRRFVSSQTNLSLLLSIFLTNERALLFKHHRARTVPSSASSSDKENKPSLELLSETVDERIKIKKLIKKQLLGYQMKTID